MKSQLQIIRASDGITFTVDDVRPSTDLLWLGTLQESLEIRSNASVLFMPNADTPALAPEGYGRNTEGAQQPLRSYARRVADLEPIVVAKRLAAHREITHPLIQAVHLAFSDHRPLVLSPDSIWLTIVQGFAQHVHENAEQLRIRLVKHLGRKTLVIRTRSLDPEEWPGLISQFSAQIKQNSDSILHETLLCNFSTTTATIRTACEIALMDTYQRYFEYRVMCICGIPRITVQGTPDDWQRIRERVEVLATYGLDWWTSRLIPVLDEFIATTNGTPNREFWQAIYKPEKAYGAELATGWITDLFPYLEGPDTAYLAAKTEAMRSPLDLGDTTVPLRYRRNYILDLQRINWLPVNADSRVGSAVHNAGVALNSFPSGLSRVPITIELPNHSEKGIELMGGFFGISQREEDCALTPVIGWAGVKPSQSSS